VVIVMGEFDTSSMDEVVVLEAWHRGGRTATSTRAPASDALLIIRDTAQLRALQITPAPLSSRTLLLDLPGISPEAARAAAERIVSYNNECGCSSGAKCMAAGFGVAVAWLALGHGVLTAHFLWRLPWALLCAFAGAGIGKAFGVARARARLHQEIDRLIAFQSALSKPEV
jgi:hypothetical protein